MLCVSHDFIFVLFFCCRFWREEMVKNVQIATVLFEALKTMLSPQNIEEKVCFSSLYIEI